MRRDPVGELLGAGRRGEGVARRPQDRDEQLGLEVEREVVVAVDGNGHARVVDEELLCGLVVLTHHDVEVSLPGPVEMAELAVAVTVGVEL